MRIGVVGCYHETNTFAPGLTEITGFQKDWHVGKAAFYEAFGGTKTSMGGVIDAGELYGFELVPLFYTQAVPSAMVSGEAMAAIQSELIAQIASESDSLHGLIMILHGAMVSEGCQDVEGKLLASVHDLLKDKPIAVTIDLHANISNEMVQLSDIIVGYDTYPHIDTYERALEASKLLVGCILGEIRPTRYLARTNILISPTLMNTTIEPMSLLMSQAFEMEKDESVLNITVAGGFSFADVNCAGATIVVTTDNNLEKAKAISESLSLWFKEHREEFKSKLLSVHDAYEQIAGSKDYPGVLIESSDNVGGGSPADATHVLRYLVDRKAPKFLMVLSDYEAVEEAFSKGVGGNFHFPVGGKTDRRYGHEPLHGEPVELVGTIRLLSDGEYKHRGPYMSGMKASMGKTAVIEMCYGESVVILTEKRVAPWDINHVHSVGIDPATFQVIVVKAAVAWRAAFGEIAKQAIELDTPGCTSSNLVYFTYRNVGANVEIIGGK